MKITLEKALWEQTCFGVGPFPGLLWGTSGVQVVYCEKGVGARVPGLVGAQKRPKASTAMQSFSNNAQPQRKLWPKDSFEKHIWAAGVEETIKEDKLEKTNEGQPRCSSPF